MARNLERKLLVTMLYNDKIGQYEKRTKDHQELGSLVKVGRAALFAVHAEKVKCWLEENHAHEFEDVEDCLEILKFSAHKQIYLTFRDATSPTKDIEKIARANDKWRHSNSNKVYDFVVIRKLGERREGLGGIELGRLISLFRGTVKTARGVVDERIRADYSVSLAVVRMLSRVETNNASEIFPVYKFTENIAVVETNRLERTAHMVQDWTSKITDLTDNGIAHDCLDQYENMIWNTHTDLHAWNTYYDQPEDEE